MASNRNSFESIYKWNVKDLYKNDDEAIKELEFLNKEIEKLKEFENHILDSSNSLYKLLELDTEISKKLERLYIYGHINNVADTTDVHYQELFGKIRNVYTK